jgi:shikimate kinase
MKGAVRKTPMNVILIGFMGVGKSTIANGLAKSLGFDVLDTDKMIEESQSRSINEIFATEGEESFREMESLILGNLLGKTDRSVISTGGGIVIREENIKELKSIGIVFWLDAGVDSILDRVSGNRDRPLLKTENPREKIVNLLSEREPLYERCADERIQTDDLSIDEISYGIAETARVWFSKQS